MAENTEKKALIDVEINAADALKQLAELRLKADELKKAQKELDDSTIEGRQEYERMGQQIKALNTEANNYQKQIQSSIKYQNEQDGSLKRLKHELSLNTAAYDRLSEAERNGAKGKDMQAHIKGISDKLKEAEDALGNHHRSVGDYGIAGKSLAKEIANLTEKLEKMAGEGKEGSAEFAAFKNQLDALKATFAGIGQDTQGMRSQMKELTEQLAQMKLNGQDNTAAFQEMTAKLSKMRDAMDDVSQGIRGMADDSSKLNAAQNVVSALTSTYGMYAAAVGLSAEEEKEMRQTMQKMTVAMTALSASVQINSLLQKQSAVYQMLNNGLLAIGYNRTLYAAKAEAAWGAIKSASTAKTKAATIAQWAWNAAISANPVALLIIALAALVAGVMKLHSAFSESAKAERAAAAASEAHEKQIRRTAAAIENINAKAHEAQAQREIDAKKEMQELRKEDLEKQSLYETEEQRISREAELRKKTAEIEQQLSIETAAIQVKQSEEIIAKKKLELIVHERDVAAQERKFKTLSKGTKEYKEQEKMVDELRNSLSKLNNEIVEEATNVMQAQASIADANLNAKEEQIKLAKEASERAYNTVMEGYKRQQKLSEAQLKVEASALGKRFTDRQAHEEKVQTLVENSAKEQLDLQLKYKKITKKEYDAELALMSEARKEFNSKQAVAANEYYAQQVASIKKLMGDNLTDQIADVEKQYREAVKSLGELKPPTPKGLSDEEFKAQTAAYEELAMQRAQMEIALEREKNKNIEELRQQSLQKRTQEVEKAFTDEYSEDFERYSDNEREKLRITIEMLGKQIAKKREAGLSTAADEAKLRAAESSLNQLQLNQDLQQAGLSAKQRYDIKMDALDKEAELYAANSDKILEIERSRAEVERELTMERIAAVEEWANRSMDIANELNSLMNALNAQELQEAQAQADQKTAASDERRASEQAKLDDEMKRNEARMQKDSKYKEAMEKKQADLDKKYANEKANIDYELAKKQAEIARQQAIREKALSIFQIAIDTAMSIAKTAATLGYPASIPFIIAAGVMGAVQTATVLATPLPEIPEPPKAARGRLVKGKSHLLGGELIEAEAGEAIINKRSTSMFAPLLSAINEAGGGIKFTSGMGMGMSESAFAPRVVEREAPIDMDAMRSTLVDAVRELKIYTTVEDIRRGEQNYTNIENNAQVF
jgi:hypothetical protein